MCTSIPSADDEPIRLKWHSLRRHAREAATIRDNLVAGLEAGAVMEVDIRLTADGRWACLHDREIRDETSGTGSLDERTAEQLSLLRLRAPSGRVTDHPVLFLEDVVAAVGAHATDDAEVQLDLKEPAEGISDEILTQFAEQVGPLARHFSLSGSEVDALSRLRSAVPALPVTYSCSAQLRGADNAEEFASRFDAALDALDDLAMVWVQHRALDAADDAGFDLVSHAHQRGVGVDTGTIDLGFPGGRQALSLARRLGVDRVTTNGPCHMAEYVAQHDERDG